MKKNIPDLWNKFEAFITDEGVDSSPTEELKFENDSNQDLLTSEYSFRNSASEILELGNNIKFNNWIIISWLNSLEDNLDFTKKRVSLIVRDFDYLPIIWTTKDWDAMFNLDLNKNDCLFDIEGDSLLFLDLLVDFLEKEGISFNDIDKLYLWSINKYSYFKISKEKLVSFWSSVDKKVWIWKFFSIDNFANWQWTIDLPLLIEYTLRSYSKTNYLNTWSFTPLWEKIYEKRLSLVLKRKIK